MPSRSSRPRTIDWRRLFSAITPNNQRSGPEINRFRMTENEKVDSFSVYSSPSLRTSDVQHDLIGELRKLSTSTAGKYDVSFASSREKCVRMVCFVIMWLPILLVSGTVMYISVLNISNEQNINKIRTGLKNLNMTLGLSTILSSEMTLIITYSHGQNSEGTQSLTDTFLRTEYYLKDHKDWPYQLCTQWKVMKTKYSLLNYLRNYRLFSKGKEAWKNSAIFHSIEQELSLCSMNFLVEGDGLIPWFNMAVIADILAFHIRLQFHISRLTYCSKQHMNDQFEMRSHLELAYFFISKARKSVTIPNSCSELIAYKKLEHSNIDFCSTEHMEFEKQRLQLANKCFFALSSEMEMEVIRTTDILLRWILVEVITLILSLLISAPTLYLVVSKHTKYLQTCEQYVLKIGRQLSHVRGRMSSVLEEVLPRQCPKLLNDATTTSKYYQNAAVLVVDIRHIWRNIPTSQPDKMIGIYNVVLKLLDSRIAQYDVHFVQRTDFFYTILSGLNNGERSTRHYQVAEMANLALDLLISASDLELGGPTTPTKIELKIGLSRGPVIGGYVYTGGLKRFRVVGETINKSTNLATSCYPNSIHLCEAVKQYLKQTGIYDIRKEIRLLVTDDDSSEKLEQCFWLIGRKVSSDVFHKTNYEVGSSLHFPKTPEYAFDINDCYTNRHRYKFL